MALLVLVLAGCAGREKAAPIETRGAGPGVEAAAPAATSARPARPAAMPPASAAQPLSPVPEVSAPAAAVSTLAPANPAAASLLARAMQAGAVGEWDRAQAALERAVGVAPDDAGLWYQLAYARFRQGQFEQALAIAERAVSLSRPGDVVAADTWRLIADIHGARGDEAAAAAALVQAAGG